MEMDPSVGAFGFRGGRVPRVPSVLMESELPGGSVCLSAAGASCMHRRKAVGSVRMLRKMHLFKAFVVENTWV